MRILTWLFFATTSSQGLNAQYSETGTYIIAAIAKDGIILAADSRTTITYEMATTIAHYDSTRKIFRIGQNFMMFAGNWTYDRKYFSYFFNRFKTTKTEILPVTDLVKSFAGYYRRMTGVDTMWTMISAGYQNGVPYVCYGTRGQTQICYSIWGIVSNIVKPLINKKSNEYTCDQLESIFYDAIMKKSKEVPNTYGIGGPIHFVRLYSNGHVSEKNAPKFQLETERDVYKAFTQKVLKLIFESQILKKKYLSDMQSRYPDIK